MAASPHPYPPPYPPHTVTPAIVGLAYSVSSIQDVGMMLLLQMRMV